MQLKIELPPEPDITLIIKMSKKEIQELSLFLDRASVECGDPDGDDDDTNVGELLFAEFKGKLFGEMQNKKIPRINY